MKYYRHLLSLISLLAVAGCEEVIELDLNDAEPRLVIEGFITDQPGPYTVKISQSAKFYDSNIFPPKTGASVIISDDHGNEDVLTEISTGVYQTSTIQGEPGVTYTLEIMLEGKTYRTTSRMPTQQIMLDSLNFKYEEEAVFYDEGYYVTGYFNDPAKTENFYRLNIFVNGEVYQFEAEDGETIEDDNFWLALDKFSDGNRQDFAFPHTLKAGDSVYIELHHLNRDTFDYYRTLVDVMDGGGVSPANPISNFGDGALGYFGAFSITSNWRIIE